MKICTLNERRLYPVGDVTRVFAMPGKVTVKIGDGDVGIKID